MRSCRLSSLLNRRRAVAVRRHTGHLCDYLLEPHCVEQRKRERDGESDVKVCLIGKLAAHNAGQPQAAQQKQHAGHAQREPCGERAERRKNAAVQRQAGRPACDKAAVRLRAQRQMHVSVDVTQATLLAMPAW